MYATQSNACCVHRTQNSLTCMQIAECVVRTKRMTTQWLIHAYEFGVALILGRNSRIAIHLLTNWMDTFNAKWNECHHHHRWEMRMRPFGSLRFINETNRLCQILFAVERTNAFCSISPRFAVYTWFSPTINWFFVLCVYYLQANTYHAYAITIGIFKNESIWSEATSKMYTALNVNHNQTAGHHLVDEINDKDIKTRN